MQNIDRRSSIGHFAALRSTSVLCFSCSHYWSQAHPAHKQIHSDSMLASRASQCRMLSRSTQWSYIRQARAKFPFRMGHTPLPPAAMRRSLPRRPFQLSFSRMAEGERSKRGAVRSLMPLFSRRWRAKVLSWSRRFTPDLSALAKLSKIDHARFTRRSMQCWPIHASRRVPILTALA